MRPEVTDSRASGRLSAAKRSSSASAIKGCRGAPIKMRILITNDDGIHAKGLEVLKAIALGLSPDVWTVAPETNQSGTSHSMTLHTPLRLRTIDERTFAVAGTPTDCVIMAVRHLLKDQPPTSDFVRHQSRLEPRRRHHLFGHRSRRRWKARSSASARLRCR